MTKGLSQGTHSARLKVTRGVNSPEELHDGFLPADEGGLRRHLHAGDDVDGNRKMISSYDAKSR